MNIRGQVKELLKDDGGATIVEYGILLGCVALACITSITGIGQGISKVFGAATDVVVSAISKL